MKRIFVVALGAIAVGFAAAIAAIWIATGPGSAPPRRGDLAPPPPDAGPPPPGRGLVDPTKVPLGAIPPPPPAVIVKDEPPPTPAPGSWEAVPILRSRRGGNVLDTSELQPRLSDCFGGNAARASGAFTQTKDFAPLVDEATTIVVLQVEIVRGEGLVVDAPVESRGTATDGTLACAQAVLRNAKVPGGGLPDGRHRVRMVLAP